MLAERYYPLGYPVDVETDDAQITGSIKTLWGDWAQLVSGNPFRVSIQRGEICDRKERFRATPAGFRMDGAGSAIFDAASSSLRLLAEDRLSEDFLRNALLTALDFSVFTPVHAACVVHNGCGVVFCGDSGAGKSTLAYACARRGWTLVTDDSLHLLPGLGPNVASLSSTIHLREPARTLFPELQQEPMTTAANGKPAMKIRSADWGVRTSRTACVERVFFLSRRPGPPQLTSLDSKVAEEYFLSYLWQPDTHVHRQRLHELAIGPGLSLFEYERIEEAVDALEALLKEKGVAA